MDIFYFECEVTNYNDESSVEIGFTTSGLTEKRPTNDLNTLGLCLFHDKAQTVQYGKLTSIENMDQIKVGDIIGVVLKRILIGGKKYSVFEICLNGIKIGHPLLSDTLIESACPTIWMYDDECSITTNLGEKPFQYDTILGTI